MGEMIWAFEQELNDDADNEFYDLVNFVLINKEGYNAWAARKQNGFRLFGRYYQNLWD